MMLRDRNRELFKFDHFFLSVGLTKGRVFPRCLMSSRIQSAMQLVFPMRLANPFLWAGAASFCPTGTRISYQPIPPVPIAWGGPQLKRSVPNNRLVFKELVREAERS